VTDIQNASTEPGSHNPDDNPDDTAADETMAVGELLWIDPRSLIVGVNVRGDAHLDRHFVADIAERGVREPITVRRNDEGELVVRKGKRRTLAAVEAGLPRVRVFVEPDPDPSDGDTAGWVERIVDQLGENAHRVGNSDAAPSGIASGASFSIIHDLLVGPQVRPA